MSRGKSVKLLAAMPPKYSGRWLQRFDKRTRIWKAAAERMGNLVADAGGVDALSHARRSLIQRATFLELLVETHEMQLAAGAEIDVGAYTMALNTLLGVYRVIGVERRSRPLRSLHEHLKAAS